MQKKAKSCYSEERYLLVDGIGTQWGILSTCTVTHTPAFPSCQPESPSARDTRTTRSAACKEGDTEQPAPGTVPVFFRVELKRRKLSGHSMESYTQLRSNLPLKSRGPLGAGSPSWWQVGPDASNHCFPQTPASPAEEHWTPKYSTE